MHYLYEYQAGFHRLALGFPSIKGCHAICLQTPGGLYGVHVLGCNAFDEKTKTGKSKMENMAAGFASFITNHPNNTAGFVRLFSVCFHGERGLPAGKTWKDEIKVYAGKLGYSGPVSNFNLSAIPNWPKDGLSPDSAYVEFRRVFDKVEILYKPWSQCHEAPGTKAADLAGVDFKGIEPTTGVVSTKFRHTLATRKVTAKGASFVLSPDTDRVSFKY